MKKIDIITLHKVPNYGSVLQTYASEIVFQELGYDTEIIDYCPDRFKTNNRLDDEYKRFSFKYKNCMIKMMFSIIMKKSLRKQQIIFDGFLDKYVNLSERYNSYEELLKAPPEADIYCTGSDQVWNTKTNGFVEYPFYLAFVKNNKKKIGFSVSFGRTKLEAEEKKAVKPLLEEYSGIGVREKSGVFVLNELGIDNCYNTLDPTLTVNRDYWTSIVSKVQMQYSDYILIYEFNNSEKINVVAEKLSKKTGLKIIRISYWYHKKYKNQECIVLPTVEEFLWLINNATYIITNSFHAVAFSTIFQKKFLAIAPKAFSVRIGDYLKLIGLEDRYISSEDQFEKCLENINYDEVTKILDFEINNTLSYLKKITKME